MDRETIINHSYTTVNLLSKTLTLTLDYVYQDESLCAYCGHHYSGCDIWVLKRNGHDLAFYCQPCREFIFNGQ